jgi:hypothetical protein
MVTIRIRTGHGRRIFRQKLDTDAGRSLPSTANVRRTHRRPTDFQVKDDGDQRIITGWASTPRVDRQGDRIDPLGVTFTNPVKLLLFHDRTLPVGNVTFHPPTAAGVQFTATLPRIAEPGPLRDRVDLAWQSIKAGLLSKVSAGYKALVDAMRKNVTGGVDFLRTEFVEMSLVTIEANPDAAITMFKAFDLAVSGRHPSAVADIPPERSAMQQTIQEQMKHWTNERQPLVTRMTEMMSPDRTLSDALEREVVRRPGRPRRRHRRPAGPAPAAGTGGRRVGHADRAARRRAGARASAAHHRPIGDTAAWPSVRARRDVPPAGQRRRVPGAPVRGTVERQHARSRPVGEGGRGRTTTDPAGRARWWPWGTSPVNSSRCCGRGRSSARSRASAKSRSIRR